MSDESTAKAEPTIFRAKVEDLERGPVRIDAEIPLPWLSRELGECEYPVVPTRAHLILTLEAVQGGVLARGSARARVRTECGKCLAEIHLDLDAEIGLFLMPRDAVGEDAEERDLTPEDLEREWYAGDLIELDNVVRDAIMLELPMNPRCEDGCRNIAGFVVSAPAEQVKDMDPRLAPLASIKLSKE